MTRNEMVKELKAEIARKQACYAAMPLEGFAQQIRDRQRELKALSKKMSTEDRLTRSQTAFRSWQEFLTELRKGYVPTLRSRSKGCQKLGRIVNAAGFNVFWIK